MFLTRRETLTLFGAAAALGSLGLPAPAQDAPAVHEVMMLNKHPHNPAEAMVFVPDLIRARPGDTIRFVPTDPSHRPQADKDMLPEGAEVWKGEMNEPIDVVVAVEGAHGFHCIPHRPMGMVGLILVGDVSGNYEAVKAVAQKGKAKTRYEDIFARADALLAAEG